MGDIIEPTSWKERSQQWKDLDDMRLLIEAVEIILQGQVPSGDDVGTDTTQQRNVRLMQVELKRRLSNNKSKEQIYKDALTLILHNAEKLMPEYDDEQSLLAYMNATKNPVLKKMFAIRQHCRSILDVPTTKVAPPPDIA